jgi:hypothetical protein
VSLIVALRLADVNQHLIVIGYNNPTISPTHVKVVAGKPYWVNLHFDGDAGTVSGAVLNPVNGLAHVGATVLAQSAVEARVYRSTRFGRTAAQGDHPDATTQSHFDNIVVDYTRAAFPLLPLTSNHGNPRLK